MEVADQILYLTQSEYIDTGPTSPCTDPIMPGTWKGSDWSTNLSATGGLDQEKDNNNNYY